MLDGIDRVLHVLQRDGQVSYAELGGQSGLSASAVNDRMNRLKGKGVLQRITIQGTHSIIALSSAKETREIDTTVPGTGQ